MYRDPGPDAMKAPWHGGSYTRRAAALVAAAAADPLTLCWRCGKRLDEHPPHRNGRRAFWTAGHTLDGELGAEHVAGGLMPEVSTCNFSHGARYGNRKRSRNQTSRDW